MRLIIGGVCQGKRQYASEQYHILKQEWVDGAAATRETLFTAKAVYDFQFYIRKALETGEQFSDLPEALAKKNPSLVLVTNEVGYGIVPMEATERMWREACGRICTKIAKEAEEVVRVCCGMGMKIK